MRFSLLSAFVGYYSVAYNELRCAMESLVRGVVFDLLALPEYRSKSEKLKKIKGFKGVQSFSELLEILEKEVGDKRFESAKVFDVIDKKIDKFNLKASFGKLLEQLKAWKIVDNELSKLLKSCYSELSEHTHRVHPKFSEPGLRVIADKDWPDLESVPREISTYLVKLIDVCGFSAYLVLKTLYIDLMGEEFEESINWSGFQKIMDRVSKLAEKYESWRRVEQLLKELLKRS